MLYKLIFTLLIILNIYGENMESKKIAYLVSDMSIPFWQIMSRGVVQEAKKHGYEISIYSADNDRKKELQNLITALNSDVKGIIVSPTSSSTCGTILKFANQKNTPVVISDIGTDSGDYISYISSDNYQGAYSIGKILAKYMQSHGMNKSEVGIISIPQKRLNGQKRTAGFINALEEFGIKSGGLYQQIDFSYEETYNYTLALLENNANIGAIWLQGSDKYQGALDAIKKRGREGEIILLTFDAEPNFLELIPKKIIFSSAMQQPFLMGEKALFSLHQHLQGQEVEKIQKLEVLPIFEENINQYMPTIKRNVLGINN